MDLYHLQADKLLQQYQALVHKVLHHFQISRYHYLYDDYHQELQIKLLEVAQQFDGNPFLEADQPRFIYMAKKAMQWRLIDIFRKEQRAPATAELEKVEHQALLDESDLLTFEGNVAMAEFFDEARDLLDNEEYSLILDLVKGERNTNQLAAFYGVSRQTIYGRKKKIGGKLMSLKGTLLEK